MNIIKNSSFRVKIIAIVLAVTMIGTLSTIMISYYSSKKSLLDMGRDQLNSVATVSKTRSIDFINRTKTFTSLLAKDRLSEGLILAYESAFYASGKSIGKDEHLNSPALDKLNNVYKDKVSEQVKSYQIARYLLVNIQGQVVFSSDFETEGKMGGRSLTSGALKDYNLAKCARDVLKSTKDEIFHSDTEYNLVNEDTYNVYCTRIIAEFDHLSEGIKRGDLMGAIVVEFDDQHLTKILSERAGMGQTGQAYILGEDGFLRTDFFINKEKYNSLNAYRNKIVINNAIIDQVKNKNIENNNLVLINPNGKEVMATFSTINVEGKKWIIIAEKETAEILAPIYQFLKSVFLVSSIIIILLIIFGIYFSTILTKPILNSIETLKGVCNDLNSDSSNLNATADELSDTAQMQARDLQSTVQAIDEISSTIDQNTTNAKNSADVSESSLQIVEFGKQVVGKMINSMNEINRSNESLISGVESSNQKLAEIVALISEIETKTKVINDIVFQTKLLSFNASVESARAGEHGKGFAVVAEEVGNLATMSGDSAKSISELLQQSIQRVNVIIAETQKEINGISHEAIEKVKEGQLIASECGDVFEKILGDVSKVSKLVGDISTASNEQNIGMTEINRAMNRLNAGTGKSTEAATKSLEAAKKLSSRADSLKDMVDILHSTIHGEVS